ncbi:MAG: hypothetical protein H0T73_12395, partial [Ardenticatenales bacterium]|nr:hypothetical protein [Ardenticatenales bacterium]
MALWVAAVTFALPNVYRPFLSFATYHHDPYDVPFRITGTTADSKFRFSSDEYISYFILNTQDNRVSDIEASVYATFVCSYFYPDQYEEKLLEFFEFCNRRLPPRPGNLTYRLEPATYLYLTIKEKRLSLDDENAQESLAAFLEDVQHERELLPEQLADLQTAARVLMEGLMRGPSSKRLQDYARALLILRKHDSGFQQRVSNDLPVLASLILHEQEQMASNLVALYGKVFSLETLIQAASQHDFVGRLEERLLSLARWEVHYLLWKYLGPLFQPDAHNRTALVGIVQQTLSAVAHLPLLPSLTPPTEAEQTLDMLIAALARNHGLLLDGACSWRETHRGHSFGWLYYRLIASLSLVERRSYREEAQRVDQRILFYEAERDIRAALPAQRVPLLEKWVIYLRGGREADLSLFFPHTLQVIWDMTQDEMEHLQIGRQVLLSTPLSELLRPSDEWSRRLLSICFSRLQLLRLREEAVPLHQRYQHHSALTEDQRALIQGALAMTTGIFDGQSVERIYRHLAQADSATYQKEAGLLIRRFFEKDVTLNAHIDML